MKYTEIFEMKYGDAIQKELTDAEHKAWDIIEDLSERRGLRQEWEQIDDEIKDEIFETWVNIIGRIYIEGCHACQTTVLE